MIFLCFFKSLCSIFYKRIEVLGLENVPKHTSVLFVSNHVNALVDPFVIMTALRRRVLLTARSSLSSFPLFSFLMKYFGVITFDRAQDTHSRDRRSHNDNSIRKCVDFLYEGSDICIFPEGQSHSDSRIRDIKTGAARIAIEFNRVYEKSGELTIIPVGLFFENKHKFRSRCVVVFGKALEFDFLEPFTISNLVRDLTACIEKGISQVTFNMESKGLFSRVLWVSELLHGSKKLMIASHRMVSLSDIFTTARVLSQYYNDFKDVLFTSLLNQQITELKRDLERYSICTTDLFSSMTCISLCLFFLINGVVLMVGFPVFVIGFLLHGVQYFLTVKIAKKWTDRKDKWASNVLFIGFFLFSIMYMCYSFLFYIFLSHYIVLFVCMMPLTGLGALLYMDRVVAFKNRMKVVVFFFKNRDMYNRFLKKAWVIIDSLYAIKETYYVEN